MGSDKTKIQAGCSVISFYTSRLFFLTVIFLAGTVSVFPQTNVQLEDLKEQTVSGTDEVKRDALNELRRFESESAARVAALSLKDTSELVKATAISAVIFMPQNEAAALVEPFLSDRSKFLRREATIALGRIGYPPSAGLLINSLKKDKDPEVRAAAAFALGLTGNQIALEPLVKLLESKPKSSRSFLRRSAARSIGQIAQALVKEEISVVTPEEFLPDKFKKGYGEPATGKTPQEIYTRAERVLAKVLSNKKESNDTRREAAFALGEIGGDASVGILRQYANDSDYYLSEICKEALIKLTDR